MRVIGLSMHEEQELGAAMREAGAVDYVTKPVVIAELLARLDPDDALDWLREIVLAEGGTWCEPPKADPMSTELPAEWPPSHLIEITVLGIFAAGRDKAELVDNWRQAAKRVGKAA